MVQETTLRKGLKIICCTRMLPVREGVKSSCPAEHERTKRAGSGVRRRSRCFDFTARSSSACQRRSQEGAGGMSCLLRSGLILQNDLAWAAGVGVLSEICGGVGGSLFSPHPGSSSSRSVSSWPSDSSQYRHHTRHCCRCQHPQPPACQAPHPSALKPYSLQKPIHLNKSLMHISQALLWGKFFRRLRYTSVLGTYSKVKHRLLCQGRGAETGITLPEFYLTSGTPTGVTGQPKRGEDA